MVLPPEEVQHWSETFELGKHCGECGTLYPWTQRKRKIEEAQKWLAESSQVSDKQKSELIESVPDLAVQSTRTELAISRFRNFLGELSSNPTVCAVLTNILGNLATEPVKKLLGL
jgi:hypothetical protein